MSNITLAGSCLCGAVRYEATGEETRFYHCHCSRCRKATGTGHASNLFLQGSLEWLAGENLLTSYVPPGARDSKIVSAKFVAAACPDLTRPTVRFLSPQDHWMTSRQFNPRRVFFVDHVLVGRVLTMKSPGSRNTGLICK